jgi:lipoprotein NlpD
VGGARVAVTLAALLAVIAPSCGGDDGGEPGSDGNGGTQPAETSLPELTAPTTTVPAPTTTLAQYYIVEPGDSLFRIAERFGVDLQELVTLNTIPNPDDIEVGQKLRIPPPTVLLNDVTTTAGPIASLPATTPAPTTTAGGSSP